MLIAAIVAGVVLCIIIGVSVYFGSHCNRKTVCSSATQGPSTTQKVSQGPTTTQKVPTCPTLPPVQNTTTQPTTSSVPPMTTTPAPIPLSAYRLPKSFSPLNYTLSMQVFIPSPMVKNIPKSQLFTFNANLSISMLCNQNTNNITMHMNHINLTANSFILQQVGNGKNIPLIAGNGHGYMYNKQLQMVTFSLDNGGMLVKGKTYILKMQYIGFLTDDLVGFYRSSYMERGVKRWMGITQFEPTDARRALPCFDEPASKAVFSVTIIHPQDLIALSNGMEQPPISMGNNWTSTSFAPTLKMSSYLLAFGVMDFSHTASYTRNNKTLFRIWSRPSLLDQTQYATKVGPQVLDLYADYFNVSFPLEKQDMIAVPDFDAGAMENWGLVTYRESRLLYKPNYSYRPQIKQSVTEVIAHELAHQWFGDLVTTAWWNDLFLNEGFAEYIEYIGTGGIPVINHAYHMGSAVIKMLNFTITQPVFVQGLTNYLNKYRYGNANHAQLWSILQQAVTNNGNILDWNNQTLNVSTFMNPWVEQMGYPVINAQRTKQTVTFTQQRFLGSVNATRNKWSPSPFNPHTIRACYSYTWFIPIWYQNAFNDSIHFTWNVPGKPTTIPGPKSSSQWYLINSGVQGYYRVNYDMNNWNLLTQQLMTNLHTFEVRNRAQLLDDAFNLAKAGQLPYGTALNLSLYLAKDTNFVAWGAASSTFSFFTDMFVLSANYPYLRKYLLSIVTPVYKAVGWNDTGDDVNDVLKHRMRYYALRTACELQLSDCVTTAMMKFSQFKAACANSTVGTSPCNPISANERTAVYCAGITHGTTDDWNLLWNYYAAEQISVEKDALLYGVSCTREPYLLTLLLNAGLAASTPASPIRKQDARYVFAYVGRNPVGRELMWNYLSSNWDQLYNKYKSSIFGLTRIAQGATRSFNTDFYVNELKTFMSTHTLGSASESFKSQLEAAMTNRDWMNTYSGKVVAWLKANTQT